MPTDKERQATAVTGDTKLLRKLPPSITTKDQATNYLQEILIQLKDRRSQCNVRIPHDKQAERRAQEKAYTKYQLHLGRCLEACNLLYSVGLLDDNAFRHFYEESLQTMLPTFVGVV